jgi:competence protein ComEA
MNRTRRSWALALVVLLLAAGIEREVVAQGKSEGNKPAAVVNLNAASAQQLEQLPGVGPRMAARIVEYRQKNGPFKKIEDLMNIRGIGEKNFLKLKPLITVGGAPASARGGDRPK